jgi:hypothetical protein
MRSMKNSVFGFVVVSLIMISSNDFLLVDAADFYVNGVSQQCINEYNAIFENAELQAAQTTYDCPFTGGVCSADFTGKHDEFDKVCDKIGGVVWEADIAVQCTSTSTLVTTGLALTNSNDCVGRSCTQYEAAELAVEYVGWNLATLGLVCYGSSTSDKLHAASSAVAGMHTNHFAWIVSMITLLVVTVMT